MSVPSSFSKDFEKCVEFHGHVCPGLAIGFQAAHALMEGLGVRRAGDEELLAIVENDVRGPGFLEANRKIHYPLTNLIPATIATRLRIRTTQ